MIRLAALLAALFAPSAWAVSLADYEGLSPTAMRAALGDPALSWQEGETLFWRFGGGNCAVLVVFPASTPAQGMPHFTSEMSEPEQQACLLSLAARPNLKAPVSE